MFIVTEMANLNFKILDCQIYIVLVHVAWLTSSKVLYAFCMPYIQCNHDTLLTVKRSQLQFSVVMVIEPVIWGRLF